MEWRPIPGFPQYEVSEWGHVRRLSAGGSPVAYKGRVLRPRRRASYWAVTLHDGTGRHDLSVHRLVLTAFVGPPPSEEHQGAHFDGDRDNNHLTNLRWATARENIADKVRHGTIARGQKAGPRRFSEVDVRAIRRLHSQGLSQERLAVRFQTSQSHVGRIVRFEAWGWVK
jgi:hypothetical protein